MDRRDTGHSDEECAMRTHGTSERKAACSSDRKAVWCLILACALAACTTHAPVREPAQIPSPGEPLPARTATVTRGEFAIAAGKLDTWNAVGQIVVRTSGATYEGRSQMLDLYSVRFRGQPFLLITRALLLSDTIKETTTLVTARTMDGKPIDSDASAALLALLQQELPAEIERVRATQAAEAQASKARSKKSKPKARGKS
jgi:hypothetical protein